ncbi:MAG: amidohydrolase, partial [Deltaproteobacteria bacterium]
MGIMVDADFVLHGGKVITIDEKNPRAQAVGVKDGKIFWVGTDEEVRQAIGKGTRVRDLKGMTVVPGFIESHNHTLMFGLGLSAIDLTKAGSIEEILTLVRKRAGRQREGTWITGVGYNQNELREKRHPTNQDLDRAAPKHLVSLRHTSAHALVVNNLVFTQAGITRNSPDPAGGKIGRDVETGELTGMLFESPAMKLVEDHMPKPGVEDQITALGRASQRFLAE